MIAAECVLAALAIVTLKKVLDIYLKKSDQEEEFLSMASDLKENSRLSCQCILEEGEGEIEVVIPDQTQNFDE
jgi:2Fe-2S ferredoxin